ncbi:MAG: carboxylating nicotinate-nucleotide diphosphorylase [Candidatus Eremiobacteraeota bacterium]|nr:carboxylating nicotinate-nucleotide diphosphorylase [Candidatus Eremiobacteraeota bacterium]MBV9263198.1 carboxylating nicotinate-nucleotide diphosphorylase [Candidatus Eremiobacteraeota bacterium]
MKPSPSDPLRGCATSPELTAEVVRAALREDTGRGGDLTTEALVAPERSAVAQIVARGNGTLAGIDVAALAFRLLDERIEILALARDGERVKPQQSIARVAGSARAILTGERTALNLLGRLSGIATATRALADRVAGTRARIADTRKTTPGLRALERYAVRCGGGVNHRFGLDDAVLIKDNHLAMSPSIHEAVAAARRRVGHMVRIEVEVDTLEQLREAVAEPIDAVLLDNMSAAQLRTAVEIVDGRVLTEASGGVTLENVRAIAETGVDVISAGSITHSAPALDFSLEVSVEE